MSAPKIPTLADVARVAGVSTATVSRCLNAPNQVQAPTRERVLRAVADLGYAPNFGARALAAKQTNTIGAVVPSIENAIFARGLQAFQEELGRHGRTLLLASSSYQPDLEEEQLRAFVARGADALLLIGSDRDEALYRFLKKRNVPTLIAWSHQGAHGIPAVGFDNKAAMCALARVVIGQGHRRLGCISAPIAMNDRARGRVEGIRQAMQIEGLDPASLHLVETPYGIEAGAAAFSQLRAAAPEASAVMCGNDVLAVGALRAARQMGLEVPRDVSITGFDDIELAMLATPALTTVHVPHREMGRRAAAALIGMLQGQSQPNSVELSTDIRLRDSLAPARA